MAEKSSNQKPVSTPKTSTVPSFSKPQISNLNKFGFKPGNRFQSINRGRR